MGFLDRFKKQKEQEIEIKASTPVAVAPSPRPVPPKGGRIEKKDKPAKVPKNVVPETLTDILLRPLVTEKSATLTSAGQYVFEVKTSANRIQVAEAIKAVYGVKPLKVQIQNLRREPVRFGRHRGKQKARKKAIVCLPKGKTISVHEGV